MFSETDQFYTFHRTWWNYSEIFIILSRNCQSPFQHSHLYSDISFPVPYLVCFTSLGSCQCNEQEQLWFPVRAGHWHASHHISKGKCDVALSITSATRQHQSSCINTTFGAKATWFQHTRKLLIPYSQWDEEASNWFFLFSKQLHCRKWSP